MKIEVWKGLSKAERALVLARPLSGAEDRQKTKELVKKVFEDVEKNGDQALLRYTKMWDGCELNSLRISPEHMKDCEAQMDPCLKDSLLEAASHIRVFHEQQRPMDVRSDRNSDRKLERRWLPIEKVACYVPAGKKPLLSSLLMTVIPAQIAACSRIVICTPPDSKGVVNRDLLGLASLLGCDEVIALGGAQAIAGLALGTESVQKVDKIFGPGNTFVQIAKQYASELTDACAIDLPAGPSELLVWADESSVPAFVAADLLAQAEHGSDSLVIVVSRFRWVLENVAKELRVQVEKTPLPIFSQIRFILSDEAEDTIEIINNFAPEHLSLAFEVDPRLLVRIRNAGAIFCGHYSPPAAGDYISGTNHVLPTAAWSKSVSGLGLESFMKAITIQTLSSKGLKDIAKSGARIARAESCEAHASSLEIRNPKEKALREECL